MSFLPNCSLFVTGVVFGIWPIVVDGCFCELCVSLPSVPMDLVVISVVKTKKKNTKKN